MPKAKKKQKRKQRVLPSLAGPWPPFAPPPCPAPGHTVTFHDGAYDEGIRRVIAREDLAPLHFTARQVARDAPTPPEGTMALVFIPATGVTPRRALCIREHARGVDTDYRTTTYTVMLWLIETGEVVDPYDARTLPEALAELSRRVLIEQPRGRVLHPAPPRKPKLVAKRPATARPAIARSQYCREGGDAHDLCEGYSIVGLCECACHTG